MSIKIISLLFIIDIKQFLIELKEKRRLLIKIDQFLTKCKINCIFSKIKIKIDQIIIKLKIWN